MITCETHGDIRGKYKNHIPLRGFDEKTAEDTHGCISFYGRGGFNSPIKAAKGCHTPFGPPFVYCSVVVGLYVFPGHHGRVFFF